MTSEVGDAGWDTLVRTAWKPLIAVAAVFGGQETAEDEGDGICYLLVQ